MKTVSRFVMVGLLVVLFGWLPESRAQQVSGVTGVVTDSTPGASVPDVDVRLENTLTGASYEAKTNSEGVYVFAKIPPGAGYRLTFVKESFRKAVIDTVSLGVGTTETRNVKLEVGQVSEIVEVKAASTTLNTTDASVGNVLNSDILHSLPLLIRESPATLLGLQAGVVANSANIGNASDANRNGVRSLDRERIRATLRLTVLT